MAKHTAGPIADACADLTNARKAWNDSAGGADETAALDAATAEVIRLDDAFADLLDIARRVAAHFEHTDAPLGVDARAAIAKATGEGE